MTEKNFHVTRIGSGGGGPKEIEKELQLRYSEGWTLLTAYFQAGRGHASDGDRYHVLIFIRPPTGS